MVRYDVKLGSPSQGIFPATRGDDSEENRLPSALHVTLCSASRVRVHTDTTLHPQCDSLSLQPCGQMAFHLSYGLTACYSNAKSVRSFAWLDPHYFPGACEFDRPRDRPPSHCDGELHRTAIRNQAS
jgi:hypothetical protein